MHAANRVRQTPTASKAATALPAPLLSSRYRNWNGIAVELHHFRGVDALVPMREHVVGVHVAGSVNLRQTRGRRTCVQHVRAGDITITPSGEPKHFQHAGENVVILLKIAPPFVQQVAGDEYALDPARFELRENFGNPDPELVTIGKQLLAGLEPEGEVGAMQVESLTIQLVLHLLRHHCTASLSGTKRIPNLSPRRLQRVLEYIDVNLRDGISLAEPCAGTRDECGAFCARVSADHRASAPSIRSRAQDRTGEIAAPRHRHADHRDRATRRVRKPQPPFGHVPSRDRLDAARFSEPVLGVCITFTYALQEQPKGRGALV